MRNAKMFLKRCRAAFPSTRKAQAHRLELRDDTLVLTLLLGDTFQEFNINESDLDKSPSELIADLAKLFEKPPTGGKPGPKKPPLIPAA